MNIFITGGSSGIGQACCELLAKQGHTITAPTRQQLDLLNTDQIDQLNLSGYDVVINCAGVNIGTYQGFYQNSTANQIHQVHINFIAPLLLVKNYSNSNPQGHFIYISSSSIDNPHLYILFNASAKSALRFAMDVIRKNLPKFNVSEICPGKTKTNMLKQNYNGFKTDTEIETEYNQNPFLTADQVADAVVYALNHKIDVIKLTA